MSPWENWERADKTPVIPELSLVVPCYNEEACLERTMPPLTETFARNGILLQLVLVDNGSTDRTSDVIDSLIARGLPVTKGVVPVNEGQGLGFLTGFSLCRGRFIGYICADGQVSPRDVVMIFEAARASAVPTLAKARRRFRPDGWLRKFVSIAYNALMQVVFFGIRSLDVNGNPKIMPADVLRRMELTSRDWFLEAEVMLKARHLGLHVIEINVPGKLREGGRSHVRLATVLEFAWNIVAYRLGRPWRAWRGSATRLLPVVKAHSTPFV
jgi:dolichol-phosphate mannosyltransferase